MVKMLETGTSPMYNAFAPARAFALASTDAKMTFASIVNDFFCGF